MVTTPFRVVELFAGDGKLGKTAHYAHMSTAQLDICMGRNSWRRTRKAFDLLTPEGIASTDCMWRRAFFFLRSRVCMFGSVPPLSQPFLQPFKTSL